MNFTSNYFSNVTCDCTFENSTVCHVTNMYDLVFLFFIYGIMHIFILYGEWNNASESSINTCL